MTPHARKARGNRFVLPFGSIRTKLIVTFGVLLGLGVANLGIYYWAQLRRERVMVEMRNAIERQLVTADVFDRLEDQKTGIDLMTGVLATENAPPPSPDEVARFTRAVDALPIALVDMV